MGRGWSAALTLVLTAGCGGGSSTSADFGDLAGVLSCADLVVWGTVTSAVTGPRSLEVTVDVDQWVHPAAGAPQVVVLGDHLAELSGAQVWKVAPDRLLVVVSEDAPTAHYAEAEGERAVQQWRDRGSRRPSREHCHGA